MLDAKALEILSEMYKNQFPDIISTILRLNKHSSRIDSKSKSQVEVINDKVLKTVI